MKSGFPLASRKTVWSCSVPNVRIRIMYSSSISPQELNALPKAAFTGEIVVLDKLGKSFDEAVAYLSTQKVLGFDTESRPCFSNDEKPHGVSLLQLSSGERAFLFRIKKTGMPANLLDLLANGKIIKVGAAVRDDVQGLEKYHKFEARSFLDLQKMVHQYGIQDISVKKMAAIILGVKISKTQQLSNWEARQLTEPQQRYAATDAWICREMYMELQKKESGK